MDGEGWLELDPFLGDEEIRSSSFHGRIAACMAVWHDEAGRRTGIVPVHMRSCSSPARSSASSGCFSASAAVALLHDSILSRPQSALLDA